MTLQKRIGRTVGVLLLLHLFGGLVLPYVLLGTATAPPDVVAGAAAGRAANMRAAVVLLVLSAGVVLSIAVIAWPVLRQSSERLALAFLSLAIANLPLQLFESGTVLTILSLSERAAASGTDAATLQAAGVAAAFARRWAHFTHLLTVVSWLFVLYLTLWRTALVPRLLAALGMVTTLLQIGAVPTRAMLGLGPVMELAMPLAPVHLALALWLIGKGMRVAPVAPDAVPHPMATAPR